MKISDIYSEKHPNNSGSPIISFEVFPPKNDEDGSKLKNLFSNLEILKKYKPAFISLTYGAGGTTRVNSLDMIKKLQNELGFALMPHFTCVCSSKEQIETYLNDFQEMGIENILALRGDYPENIDVCYKDFKHANELVAFIKERTDFSIGVAGYPEIHIECDDMNLDLQNLKRKIDAGGDVIYTQMFFDNEKYFRFVDNVRNIGIDKPVIPGILPVQSFPQLEKMLSMARVAVPQKLMTKLEKYKHNIEDIKKIGIEFAAEQCQELITEGVRGLHFYTLNNAYAVSEILDNLASKVNK